MKQTQNLMRLTFSLIILIGITINTYAESVTYKQGARNETASLNNPNGAQVIFNTTYPNDSYTQLTGGYKMTYTFSGFDGYDITGITLSMKSNSKAGKGSLNIKIGNTSIANISDSQFNSSNWNGAWSTNYIDITPKITTKKVENGELITITIEATENSLYCQSVTIEYTKSENYIEKPTLPASCNFTDSKTIEITKNTENTTIFYTTDGTTPSANSIEYTEPFTITETTTVKAIAVNNNYSSAITEATYTKVLPECVLPQVSPQGGETPETATEILQYSTITITPADYNTVTYSINGGKTTIITESTSIIVDNAGTVILTITSEYGNEQLEKTYYYNAIKSNPRVTAVLTSEDIKNKKDTGEGYAENNLVESICGDWTGYFASNKSNGFLQLINKDGYHIQSPEFPGKIISVSITFTASTESNPTRSFVIMPTSYTNKTADTSTPGNLGSASYKGKSEPTSTVKLTGDATSFKIYATSGAIYFSRIEVVYEKPANHVLEVGPTGWATLYLGLDAAIPDRIRCYTLSSVNDNTATLSPITGTLPAHTGIIVKATANTSHTFKYNTNYVGNENITNLLEGSIIDKDITEEIYILSVVDDIVGLYKAKQSNGAFTNNEHKAYLPASIIPTTQQSNKLQFKEFNDDDTTDAETTINTIQHSETVIYDLKGYRINKMNKGIYIVNGRKIINNQ